MVTTIPLILPDSLSAFFLNSFQSCSEPLNGTSEYELGDTAALLFLFASHFPHSLQFSLYLSKNDET